jgi:hypothetical protein
LNKNRKNRGTAKTPADIPETPLAIPSAASSEADRGSVRVQEEAPKRKKNSGGQCVRGTSFRLSDEWAWSREEVPRTHPAICFFRCMLLEAAEMSATLEAADGWTNGARRPPVWAAGVPAAKPHSWQGKRDEGRQRLPGAFAGKAIAGGRSPAEGEARRRSLWRRAPGGSGRREPETGVRNPFPVEKNGKKWEKRNDFWAALDFLWEYLLTGLRQCSDIHCVLLFVLFWTLLVAFVVLLFLLHRDITHPLKDYSALNLVGKKAEKL